jgi:hypothetical protein
MMMGAGVFLFSHLMHSILNIKLTYNPTARAHRLYCNASAPEKLTIELPDEEVALRIIFVFCTELVYFTLEQHN